MAPSLTFPPQLAGALLVAAVCGCLVGCATGQSGGGSSSATTGPDYVHGPAPSGTPRAAALADELRKVGGPSSDQLSRTNTLGSPRGLANDAQ